MASADAGSRPGVYALPVLGDVLGSDRDQAGLIAGALVVAATLGVERVLFGQHFAPAARAVGLGWPRQQGLFLAVRDAVWSVDQGVPVFDTRTMDEIVSRSLETRRFAVTMLSCFAILALALAVIGLYGVLSYAVAQRTSELGVRFAMGATPGQVLQLVVGHGLRLTMTGILIGVSFGAVAARGISHLLYGVSVNGPATFLGAACLLMLIAAVASYLPARRASRLDPVTALRFEQTSVCAGLPTAS